MAEPTPSGPTRTFWIVSVLALLWNLIGVLTYVMQVTMGEEALASLPDAERALYTDIPAWATGAYAVAVFAGTLGCVALLVRKAWAVPLLVVSLVAIIVQMTHALFLTELIQVRGMGAAVLPLLIVVIAALLVRFSAGARNRGWLA